MPVLRLSPTKRRKIEAMRDRLMFGLGTDEPWVIESSEDILGLCAVAIHYRRPLRVDEVNQLADTIDVRQRLGRA